MEGSTDEAGASADQTREGLDTSSFDHQDQSEESTNLPVHEAVSQSEQCLSPSEKPDTVIQPEHSTDSTVKEPMSMSELSTEEITSGSCVVSPSGNCIATKVSDSSTNDTNTSSCGISSPKLTASGSDDLNLNLIPPPAATHPDKTNHLQSQTMECEPIQQTVGDANQFKQLLETLNSRNDSSLLSDNNVQSVAFSSSDSSCLTQIGEEHKQLTVHGSNNQADLISPLEANSAPSPAKELSPDPSSPDVVKSSPEASAGVSPGQDKHQRYKPLSLAYVLQSQLAEKEEEDQSAKSNVPSDTPNTGEEVMDCETSVPPPDDHRFNISTKSVPKILSEAREDFEKKPDNFLRGCKWSPDGSSLVTNSNDNTLRLFPLATTSQPAMSSSAQIRKGSQIYDFTWHPDSQRVISSSAGVPIHMWNIGTGKNEASYVAYDQYDEITAANSVCVTPCGARLYAGYNKTIRVFDIDRPGRTYRTIKTFEKKKKEGQSGIISCFAMSPDGNGVYVAGSYDRYIGLYDSNYRDQLVWLLQGQGGGVTHLAFSPDGLKLYSGGRKDAEILCWDMRNTGKVLYALLRQVDTNQRIYFDLSQSGRYVTSGNHDGSVTIWDSWQSSMEALGDTMYLLPCAQFVAHRDTVNGISFNHSHHLLATASGRRHFDRFTSYDSDNDTDDSDGSDGKGKDVIDFSLRVWTIPKMEDASSHDQ